MGRKRSRHSGTSQPAYSRMKNVKNVKEATEVIHMDRHPRILLHGNLTWRTLRIVTYEWPCSYYRLADGSSRNFICDS